MNSWVYYCDDGRDRIKIGYSVNPSSRLAEFRTVNPEIEMVLRERSIKHDGRELEQKRHEQFREEHIAGEWYRRSDRLSEWIGFVQAISRLRWSIANKMAWASVFPKDAACTFNIYQDGKLVGDIDNPPEEWLKKGGVSPTQ